MGSAEPHGYDERSAKTADTRFIKAPKNGHTRPLPFDTLPTDALRRHRAEQALTKMRNCDRYHNRLGWGQKGAATGPRGSTA